MKICIDKWYGFQLKFGMVFNRYIQIGELSKQKQKLYLDQCFFLYPNYRVDFNDDGFIVCLKETLKIALVMTNAFFEYAQHLVNKFAPTYIFTQLEGCLEIISYAQERNIPVIHFLRDTTNPYNFKILDAPWIDLNRITFVSNSFYTKSYYHKNHKINSTVSYPLPIQCKCQPRLSDFKNDVLKILYINPHETKGISIVSAIMDYFEENLEFHIVEGWDNKDFIKVRSKSYLIKHPKQYNLCDLYMNCEILIIPSQASEAFSRVAAEGMKHGMTIIASKHSGLEESISYGGILIEKYWDSKEWILVLRKLIENRKYLSYYSTKAVNRSAELLETNPEYEVMNILKRN